MTGTPLAILKVLEKKSGGFTKDAQLSQVSGFLKKVGLWCRVWDTLSPYLGLT